MATFADRLNFLRKERGWTKAEMYRCMEIAPITLTGYLSGKNSPNIDAVRGYAEKLGVSLSWLAGEEEEKNSSLLVPGKSSYADVISIINQVLTVAGFYVDIGVDQDEIEEMRERDYTQTVYINWERVKIKTNDSIMIDYYKTYENMSDMLKDGRITEVEFKDFMEMKRKQLANQIVGEKANQEDL